MKKSLKIFLLLFLCNILASPFLYAQKPMVSVRKHQKIEKLKRRELRLKASLQSRRYYAQLLKQKLFVLQADQLYGYTGAMIPVNSSTNFLAIKGNKVIFQYGFIGRIGWNGVGGVTAEGFIDHYLFNPGKSNKKAMLVSGQIRPKGAGDTGYFTLTVSNDGSAYLNMTLPFGGRISMSGRIVDFAHASVFKGQTMF